MHSQADADAGSDPRFLILGPLAIHGNDGTPVPVARPLDRKVLATLLLRAGHPCPVGWLAGAVWGEDEMMPADPAGALRSSVYRLRRQLGAAGLSLLSVADSGFSYKVGADASMVDAGRFEDLARRGRIAYYRDEYTAVASLSAAAIRLWRGPILADVPDTVALADIRGGLLRAREDVEDLWMDARLALGLHRAAVSELRERLACNRLREHVWAQLMLALFRDGKPEEAQAEFRNAQNALNEEYGMGPGPELCELHCQISAGGAGLLAAAPILA
jgi:DNA-binding SARP family transcriptional activator